MRSKAITRKGGNIDGHHVGWLLHTLGNGGEHHHCNCIIYYMGLTQRTRTKWKFVSLLRFRQKIIYRPTLTFIYVLLLSLMTDGSTHKYIYIWVLPSVIRAIFISFQVESLTINAHWIRYKQMKVSRTLLTGSRTNVNYTQTFPWTMKPCHVRRGGITRENSDIPLSQRCNFDLSWISLSMFIEHLHIMYNVLNDAPNFIFM